MLSIELHKTNTDGTTTCKGRFRRTYRTMRGAESFRQKLTGRYPEPQYELRIVGEEPAKPSRDYAEAAAQVHVGDIFHCCWGYDMLINDFYEVIALSPSGKTATIRPLRMRSTGSCHDIGGCYVSPVLTGDDRFDGKPMTKRIMGNAKQPSITITTHQHAYLMSPEDYTRGYNEDHNN